MAGTNRVDELRLGLEATRERIDHACQQAGRSSNDVTVVVVTKTYPVSDVEILQDLGVTDVGAVAASLFDIGNPELNWVSLANGFGVPAAVANSGEELCELLENSYRQPGPFLIQANCLGIAR